MTTPPNGGRIQRSLAFAPHIGLTAPDAPLFLHSARSADPLDQIAWLNDHGFAGIEDNSVKLRPAETQMLMGAELARRGMRMGCFVNNPMVWNKPVWGSADSAAQDQLDQDLDDSIAAIGRLGGRCVTVVSGRDPAIPLGYQWAAMIENLKRRALRAEAAGLVLAIETVDERRWPSMLLHHIADAYAIVKAVGSPAVKLVFDIGHVHAMDGQIIANLGLCWDEIAAIQIADQPGRFEPGSGEINWINVFRFIRDRGYTGLIELEHVLSTPGAVGERILLDNLHAIDRAL